MPSSPAFLHPVPLSPSPSLTTPFPASRPLPPAHPRTSSRRPASSHQSSSSPSPPPSPSPSPSPPPPRVLYFAYGSNLSPKTFGPAASAPRNLKILSATPATLPNHRIAFYPTPLPSEPAFLTVLPSDSLTSTVHGVLYALSPSSFASLAASEGVLPSPFPSVQTVTTVRVRVGDSFVLAKTFTLPAGESLSQAFPNAAPSRRYAQLVAHGFAHHNLDTAFLPCPGADASKGSGAVFEPTAGPSPKPDDDAVAAAVDAAYAAFADDKANHPSDGGTHLRLLRLTPPSPSTPSSPRPFPRPILVFLPGLDGSGYSIVSQVPSLVRSNCDVFALRVPFGNRLSWRHLGRQVLSLIETAQSETRATQTIIVGESMGGCIALRVALENGFRPTPLPIDQLVLVNPATSFRSSELSRVWINLANRMPRPLYERLIGPLLVPFILDLSAIPAKDLPTVGVRRLSKLRHFVDNAATLLPQGAVMHRLQLLNDFRMSPADFARVARGARTKRLLIAENDNLLPVVKDSRMLLESIDGLQRCVLPYGGHAMLQDARVSLGDLLFDDAPAPAVVTATELHQTPPSAAAAALSTSDLHQTPPLAAAAAPVSTSELYQPPPPPPPPLATRPKSSLRDRVLKASWSEPDKDLVRPITKAERATFARKFGTTTAFHAPVVVGTERLPVVDAARPVLFVCNHTLLGSIDALTLIQHVMEHRGKAVHALAHPALFTAFGQGGGSDPVVRLPGVENSTVSEMKRFGVMSISPRALVRELANNNWVLLFPGGAREALKRRTDAPYSLHWPSNAEFIRVAAAMNAIVVPVSTVGTEDSVSVFLDSSEVGKVASAVAKFRGDDLEEALSSIPSARQWRGDVEEKEAFLPPLGAPKLPDRVYLRYGEPIEVPAEAEHDKTLARRIYGEARDAVEDGVAELLKRRENDNYRTPSARLAFRLKFGEGVQPPAQPAWTWETKAGPIDK